MAIHAARYFLQDEGNEAVSTVVEGGAASTFKATIQLPATLVFEGDSNAVMDALSTLANHFADAREGLLTHLTEG
jgi:hypothetical protein